jgi:hypothetical protein
MTMKAKLFASLRGLLVVMPVCFVTPVMSGCGTSFGDLDEALDQLFEDLDDADDLEEIGEAFDDFEEAINDD